MFVAQTIIVPPSEATQARSATADDRLRLVERVRPVPRDGEGLDLRDSRRPFMVATARPDGEDRPATTDGQARTDGQAGDRQVGPLRGDAVLAESLRADRGTPLLGRAGAAFLAHVLGQTEFGPVADEGVFPGAAVGTDAYRRAGGEPQVYPETPAYFRLSA